MTANREDLATHRSDAGGQRPGIVICSDGRGFAILARMRHVAIVLGIALAIAACAYKPGSYQSPSREFVGQRTSVGCLDIAVDRRTDMGSSAVLGYTFGNRCDHPAVIDLAWVNVIGRTATGAEITLVPYDPKGELKVVRLDGRQAGSEAIAYPAPEALGQLCVDVASLAQTRPAQWLCFGNPEAIAMVTP
jgi:hypothetical protein